MVLYTGSNQRVHVRCRRSSSTTRRNPCQMQQIEETASEMFEAIVHADNISIDYIVHGAHTNVIQFHSMCSSKCHTIYSSKCHPMYSFKCHTVSSNVFIQCINQIYTLIFFIQCIHQIYTSAFFIQIIHPIYTSAFFIQIILPYFSSIFLILKYQFHPSTSIHFSKLLPSTFFSFFKHILNDI